MTRDGTRLRAPGALAIAAAALLLTPASFARTDASRWQLIRNKASYGDFTVTATSATVNRPKGIAVRIVGSGTVIWACSRGFSVSSWSRQYRSGFHVLPYVRNKDTCDVTASASGQGVARVQIYRAKW
jgi:hypothetical protein